MNKILLTAHEMNQKNLRYQDLELILDADLSRWRGVPVLALAASEGLGPLCEPGDSLIEIMFYPNSEICPVVLRVVTTSWSKWLNPCVSIIYTKWLLVWSIWWLVPVIEALSELRTHLSRTQSWNETLYYSSVKKRHTSMTVFEVQNVPKRATKIKANISTERLRVMCILDVSSVRLSIFSRGIPSIMKVNTTLSSLLSFNGVTCQALVFPEIPRS